MAEKRTADSILSQEFQGVCANCSKTSNNLRSCEHCGCSLSAHSLTAAKRPRLDVDTDSSSHQRLTNGVSEDNNNSSRSRVNGTTDCAGASYPAERGPTGSSASSGSPVPATTVMNGTPVPEALFANNSNVRGPSPAPLGPPTPAGGSISSSALPMGMFRNINNQAVPMQSASAANTGAAATANSRTSNDTTRASTNAAAPPPYSAPSSATNSEAPPASRGLVIDVHQIRVGVKKFVPMQNSSVLFKDDGVLFTLKEYPNAPLLLNARAIQQCKANLTSQMPAMFFYLEGSCIKQIRNIFKMTQPEFSERATDRASTIALFPVTMDSAKAQGIKNAFEVMRRKFNRPQNLLKEVSASVIVDLMYSHPSDGEASAAPPPSTTSSRTAQPQSGPPPLLPTQRTTIPTPIASYAPRLTPVSDMIRNAAVVAQSMVHHQMPGQHPMMQQRQMRPVSQMTRAPSMTPGSGYPGVSQPRGTLNQPPPLLSIPENPLDWNVVKKKLVPGGVYQVQTRDGQKKYCLWNGTSLVPCLVQDQEVQLQCETIRIGSMRCKSVDTVRIRNDGSNSGIYFKILNPSSRSTDDLVISQNELQDCVVCFFGSSTVMFVYPNDTCANKIRTKCRLPGPDVNRDPSYSPHSREERRRHLILFLKDVNTDQKESLLKMKRTGVANDRPMCRTLDATSALKILSDIRQNTSLGQAKISDYFGKTGQHQSQAIEQLVRELQNPEVPDVRPAQPDDDDDDVIMTQEEIGVKCPYTQKVMKEPYKNKICGHNYEKAAILDFIERRKAKGTAKGARCPYAGCGNQKALALEDMVDNTELRQYIQKQVVDGTLST